jgi:anaerobic selenocysteine-containing dehydrogenase
MKMAETKKTRCVLCGNLCGLEVQVEDNRIVKVRPDKQHPRSQGYICRKGRSVAHYQHHADRLLYPMKKVGDAFERVSWDQALDEIAEKLQAIVDAHGPHSLALMGGGTLASPVQMRFGLTVLNELGSQYVYNAIAQELTGRFWVDGRTFGRQTIHPTADEEEADMLLIVGKNPMMSHHFQRARTVLKKMAKDPERLLVVVDPRRTETAKIADIHLAIRPGTDALFYRAMISIILNEGWHDQDYIDRHVTGFEGIRPWFTDFHAKAALEVCELDFEEVREVSRLFATRRSCHDSDLGVLMNRHSTLVSYLETILRAVCGRIGVPGGNVLPSSVLGLGAHSDERDPGTWRTVASDFPAITGLYPPNVMPEEILSDHPERLRAVIVSAANPLRSFADTTAYEEAFAELDLLVTIDVAMTETAAASQYVLPDLSGFESWNTGIVLGGYPKVFFQINQPSVQPEGEQLEAAEIFTRLADRLGLIPDIPASLIEAAESGDRLKFGLAFMEFVGSNPDVVPRIPFVLARTLGKSLGSVNLATIWAALQALSPETQENAQRAGFTPGPLLGEEIFKASLEHPQGLWVGELDPDENLKGLATDDGRINLDIPELKEWMEEIDPAKEAQALELDPAFPFIMSAGNHMDMNSNTAMRDPTWNEGKRACTLYMNPKDAEDSGFKDGQLVRVTTEAGQESVELQVTEATRPGYLVMPQGFGLIHQGKTFGANANRLAKNTHRDRLAATPYHRYIPCRVEAAS